LKFQTTKKPRKANCE